MAIEFSFGKGIENRLFEVFLLELSRLTTCHFFHKKFTEK